MPPQQIKQYSILLSRLLDNTQPSHHDFNDIQDALAAMDAALLKLGEWGECGVYSGVNIKG